MTSQVKAAIIGKVILIFINLIVWPSYFYMAIEIPVDKEKGFIVPLIAFLFILIFVLGRYTVWNFWGEEYVRINTKSINYTRSYGIFRTNEKMIKINRLGWAYETIRYFENTEYGKIYFSDYDPDNNPKVIFETTILIRKIDADAIFDNIQIIYSNEYFEENKISPFTLN
jgi:hypothetical protein